MNYLIRKMKEGDIYTVYSLGISEKVFSSKSGSFWQKEQLVKWVQSQSDILLVAEKDNNIIGFSLYSVHVPTGKVTWENLYVIPTERKLGVASELIKRGLEEIKKKGYKYIMGLVNAEDKKEFLSLIEDFGFKNSGNVTWIDQSIK